MGETPAGTGPAAVTAFRVPLTFDRERLELKSIAPGRDGSFALAAFPAANATGQLVIAAAQTGVAPTGIVSIATLEFKAKAAGGATIAADTDLSVRRRGRRAAFQCQFQCGRRLHAQASNVAAVTSAPVSIRVAATAPLKPGMIVAASSYGYNVGAIFDVTSGAPVEFARVPSRGWVGGLLFTLTGRLIVATNYAGAS